MAWTLQAVSEAGPGPRLTTVGRPLPAPRSPDDLAEHYDLTVGRPRAAEPGVFEGWLAEACAVYGLSCALLDEGVVDEAVRRLGAGAMTVGWHLDRGDDSSGRLARA